MSLEDEYRDDPEVTQWQGRFITAKTRGRWEYVSRARGIKAAVILAITPEDEVVLVEQFRIPLGKPCIELPAGLIGDDDGGCRCLDHRYVTWYSRETTAIASATSLAVVSIALAIALRC